MLRLEADLYDNYYFDDEVRTVFNFFKFEDRREHAKYIVADGTRTHIF